LSDKSAKVVLAKDGVAGHPISAAYFGRDTISIILASSSSGAKAFARA
jgi:hypothetical protein